MAVAITSFLGERNGSRFEIVVEIGQPYRCSNKTEEWACPVALHGLYDRLHDMHGGDALQALCLAVRLVFSLLEAFKEEGGRILYKDGKDVTLDSYVLNRSVA